MREFRVRFLALKVRSIALKPGHCERPRGAFVRFRLDQVSQVRTVCRPLASLVGFRSGDIVVLAGLGRAGPAAVGGWPSGPGLDGPRSLEPIEPGRHCSRRGLDRGPASCRAIIVVRTTAWTACRPDGESRNWTRSACTRIFDRFSPVVLSSQVSIFRSLRRGPSSLSAGTGSSSRPDDPRPSRR